MNSKQRIAILVGTLVVVAVCVYPPWRVETGKKSTWTFSGHTTYSPSNIVPGKYALLFSPPRQAAGIDTGRLFAQIVIVAALTGGAVFGMGGSRRNE